MLTKPGCVTYNPEGCRWCVLVETVETDDSVRRFMSFHESRKVARAVKDAHDRIYKDDPKVKISMFEYDYISNDQDVVRQLILEGIEYTMETKNRFNLSDFSVDIYEQEDSLSVRVDCFADDGIHAPFNVYELDVISKTFTINEASLYYALSMTIAKLINDIISSDIQRPTPCECRSREWFDKHPYDRQEYWRTKNGRIYPKDHTVHCPKNPANRRSNND